MHRSRAQSAGVDAFFLFDEFLGSDRDRNVDTPHQKNESIQGLFVNGDPPPPQPQLNVFTGKEDYTPGNRGYVVPSVVKGTVVRAADAGPVTLKSTGTEYVRQANHGSDPNNRPISELLENGVRKVIGCSKTGHSRTLDPKVTGILVVCLGKATRLVKAQQTSRKEYVAVVQLSVVNWRSFPSWLLDNNTIDNWMSSNIRNNVQLCRNVRSSPPCETELKDARIALCPGCDTPHQNQSYGNDANNSGSLFPRVSSDNGFRQVFANPHMQSDQRYPLFQNPYRGVCGPDPAGNLLQGGTKILNGNSGLGGNPGYGEYDTEEQQDGGGITEYVDYPSAGSTCVSPWTFQHLELGGPALSLSMNLGQKRNRSEECRADAGDPFGAKMTFMKTIGRKSAMSVPTTMMNSCRSLCAGSSDATMRLSTSKASTNPKKAGFDKERRTQFLRPSAFRLTLAFGWSTAKEMARNRE
ncbi:MAG: hypothetical protein M1831_006544 [Alyxoria varia]|nr:MAG: hypothetical protein M1831_006544 [Alyxoria varia]